MEFCDDTNDLAILHLPEQSKESCLVSVPLAPVSPVVSDNQFTR